MKGANSVLSKRSFPGKERRSPGPGVPSALPCGESLFIFLNEDEDLWEFATGIADEPVRVWRLKGNALSDLTREGWKIEGSIRMCPKVAGLPKVWFTGYVRCWTSWAICRKNSSSCCFLSSVTSFRTETKCVILPFSSFIELIVCAEQ
jgi:hypothetical protein